MGGTKHLAHKEVLIAETRHAHVKVGIVGKCNEEKDQGRNGEGVDH